MDTVNVQPLSAWFAPIDFTARDDLLEPRRAPKDQPGGTGSRAEQLEGRTLLSVAVSQNTTTNVLSITGDANVNDVYVYQTNGTPDQVYVEVSSEAVTYGPFNVDADLTLINVSLGASGDSITFENASLIVLGDEPVGVPASVSGGDGDDTLSTTDQSDTVTGDNGDDAIFGGDGGDSLYGNAGADQLNGEAGDDNAYGGAGNDTLHGNDGGDVLWGDDYAGNETGADRLYGDAGNDNCYGGSGSDTLDGGNGDDWVWGDHPTVNTNTGDDDLAGGNGNDTFKGGPGNDVCRALDSSGHDTVDGGTGTDTLFDHDANDTWSAIEIVNP